MMISRPPCRRFHLAPSQRSSPQAISHSFPSVHPVVASISLLPNAAPPRLFPTVSRPPCRRFHLAPSQRSSPQAIFPPSTLSSLPFRSFPMELSPQAISHGGQSSLPSRFLPTELSPGYFPLLSYRSLAASVTKREPKHQKGFWEKCPCQISTPNTAKICAPIARY